jgi:uncharacterized membrane protein
MADRARSDEPPQPPAPSEAIHLPGPSYLPILVATGIAITLVGVVLSWILVVIGVIVFLIPAFRWIRETREDISELPLEH